MASSATGDGLCRWVLLPVYAATTNSGQPFVGSQCIVILASSFAHGVAEEWYGPFDVIYPLQLDIYNRISIFSIVLHRQSHRRT